MRRRSAGQTLVTISWDEANDLLAQWMTDAEGSLAVVTSPIRGGNARIAGDVT